MTDLVTPIDRYLAEQQAATAVDRFARHHDARSIDVADDRWYAERLPTTAPGVGEQYAFRVDLDRCSGCKSCVAACHSLNGLDEAESWRTVGLLVDEGSQVGSDRRRSVQHVPSGCHHCVEPACLAGCPTNAYEKDPFSGIVRHLDDQCFGCGYCELTCPYEVPTMNARLGVVRKCDMCADRLSEGEAPACVQACPTNAIAITVVDTAAMVEAATHSTLVPGAPASVTTVPTTQYVSSVPLPDTMVGADHHALHLSAAHPPLAFMLVLTQVSVGAFVAGLAATAWSDDRAAAVVLVTATATGAVALGGAFAHLGRPLVAWRAVLGFAHSWFSREVVAFSAYLGAALSCCVAVLSDRGSAMVAVTGGIAGLGGLGGVACSAQIYVVTRRTWWRRRFVATKFAGTMVGAGSAVFASSWASVGGSSGILALACAVGVVAMVAKLADETSILRLGRPTIRRRVRTRPPSDDLVRTAHLLRQPSRTATTVRVVTGLCGAVLLAVGGTVAMARPAFDLTTAFVVTVATLSIVTGEFIERYQFFIASVAPRMPGGFGS